MKCKTCNRKCELVFCSNECEDESHVRKVKIKKPRKIISGFAYKKRKVYLSENKCIICGEDVYYKTKKHFQRFCSTKCQSKFQYKKVVKEPVEKTCPVCGDKFQSFRSVQVYCNRECQLKNSMQVYLKKNGLLNISTSTR